MREILFRGKRADTGEWIYGDLRQDADLESAYIGGWDYFIADYALQREPFEYPVSPETVSQFTGLYDKNGKKIFEGDIIKLTINRSLIFSVNWVDDCGMFCLKCLSRHPRLNLEAFDTDFTTVDGDECEIIGNVFDNSDLLKGE